MNFHVCFVGQKFPLTGKTSNTENIWPIAEKLSEMGVKVSIVAYKAPSNEPLIQQNKTTIYFVASGNDFIPSEDFPCSALKKLKEIHNNCKIDHVHSLDTPFRKFKTFLKPNKPSLSYGVQASSIEEMFNLLSVDESLTGLLISNLLNPLSF